MCRIKRGILRATCILICCDFFSVVQAFDQNTADTLDFGYFKEDVCWSSELDGCDVIGLYAEYSLAFENYYLLAGLGHFYSKDKRDPHGDPLLNSTTTTLGIGREFILFPDFINGLTLNLEGLIKLQTDDDFGNSNSNSGPEIRIRLQKNLDSAWQIGAELIEQKFQNCSHPDCHQLGSEKPIMQNTLGLLFISYQFSEQWRITYKTFDVISLPDNDVFNGREPDYAAQLIELNYLLE